MQRNSNKGNSLKLAERTSLVHEGEEEGFSSNEDLSQGSNFGYQLHP